MGIGRILLSPQHFFPHPQLAPATTKPPTMLPTHTCTSPHQSPRVFCTPLECLCPASTQSAPCAPCQITKSLHMHTGPRGPLLFGWCTHYVPTTSHQPLASFCTAPAPLCTLRAWLHCHMWTCPSIHVSLCLEEFSPQTSPSGTNYPMVGVLSMCPPHHFSQIPTSGHLCRPARTRFFLHTWPFMACAPPC